MVEVGQTVASRLQTSVGVNCLSPSDIATVV